MAFLQMNYHSDALRMGVSVNVILPENAKSLIGMKADGGAEYKTLYLLHGLSDDHTIWMRRTSIERYASEYGIAVVIPGVARSWYTDTADGARYLSFVSRELPAVCRGYFRGMSGKREDTMIAGLSMGGYGAIKAALTCPETFGGCASLSGALDIADLGRVFDLSEWRGIFGFGMESAGELRDSEHDIFYLVKKNREENKPFPKTYMWCGESDHLLRANNRFSALLDSEGLPHLYETSEGDHSWKWWDLHICDALKYLLK
ncbi:MAG: esterase family protein [Clostridia bacterium]|nr:esterase family protein [Clostridia bacterium]